MTTITRIKRNIKRKEDLQRFHNLILATQGALSSARKSVEDSPTELVRLRREQNVKELERALDGIFSE